MKQVMALDIGEKRIGVAVNRGTSCAFPHTVLLRKGKGDVARVLFLARELGVDTIVVGLPVRTDASLRREAESVLSFVEALRERFSGKVELFDERFSTREAERRLIELETSRAKRKGLIDKISAALILEAYLARERA